MAGLPDVRTGRQRQIFSSGGVPRIGEVRIVGDCFRLWQIVLQNSIESAAE